MSTLVIGNDKTSSAAAEIDAPLRAQSKVPDVYSSIRECVCVIASAMPFIFIKLVI